MAAPRITDRIGSPSRMASLSRFRYKAPMPSARPYPSADASKVWQVEVRERTPPFIVAKCCSGDWIRLALATMAPSHSRFSSAVQAICKQYSEEEQAVSMTKLREKIEVSAPCTLNTV